MVASDKGQQESASAPLRIGKILLPIDLQTSPSNVVTQAAAVARQFQSEIVILHVVTPLSYSAATLSGSYVPKGREDLMAELLRLAQQGLDDYLRPELEGLPVKRLLRQGDPAGEIVAAARAESADLIMMPTHGYGGFRRFLLGSVTAKVLHDSEVAVWTGAHLRQAPEAPFFLNHILCGVDLGPQSRKLVSWAAQFAARFHARLTLAHITAVLDAYAPAPAPEWKAALASLAAEQMTLLKADVGSKADLVVESGDVANRLNEAAEARGADVLVIGRHPAHFGGTGYAIVRESKIPVVSVQG
jgi:nucleotide-binding universal stress UspA family protein